MEDAEKEWDVGRGRRDVSDTGEEMLFSLRLRSASAFLDLPWRLPFPKERTGISEKEAEVVLGRGRRLRRRAEPGVPLREADPGALCAGEGEGLSGATQSSERSSSQGCAIFMRY